MAYFGHFMLGDSLVLLGKTCGIAFAIRLLLRGRLAFAREEMRLRSDVRLPSSDIACRINS